MTNPEKDALGVNIMAGCKEEIACAIAAIIGKANRQGGNMHVRKEYSAAKRTVFSTDRFSAFDSTKSVTVAV